MGVRGFRDSVVDADLGQRTGIQDLKYYFIFFYQLYIKIIKKIKYQSLIFNYCFLFFL